VIAINRELVRTGTHADALRRVHAPVGIDIGAVTPEEIAVAVVAEMIAVRRNSEAELPHMKSRKAQQLLTEAEEPR